MSSSPAPLISVVIPTRHRNHALAECLRRLAPGVQTLAPDRYEVIVTDDGTISTAKAMVRDQFPWARWIAGPQKGAGSNRNHGVQQAIGPWIAFVDDDCLPATTWLQGYVAAIAPAVELYSGKTTCHDKEHPQTPICSGPYNLDGSRVYSCNLLVSTKLHLKIGGFDPDFPHWNEDVDFIERLRRNGHSPLFVPAALIHHPPRRRHLGTAAGKQWKSRVMLSYKQGNSTPAWRWLPGHLIKVRIRQIIDCQPSVDSLIAVITFPAELFYVLTHIRKWDQAYKIYLPEIGSNEPPPPEE